MPDSPDNQSIAKGFRKRTLVTAKLGVKLGVKAAKTALNVEGKPEDDDAAMAAAMAMLEEIDGLKGLVMKFGQMASYLGTAFPPQAQRMLAKLQAEASALPFADIRPVLEAELGEKVENLFDEFEETAFAAASIGQVHKAVYRGKAVAVKVQYPGVEDAIRSDLKIIGNILLLGLTGAMQDGKGLTRELKQRILEECDYRNELENQRYFIQAYRDDPGIIIPQVYAERSSKRVLTTEFIPGKGFHDFRQQAPQALKNTAAENIFRFCIRSIFHYGVFNADPHPGNYLFMDDGRVAFLDFGCVKRFTPELIGHWRGMVTAVLEDDLPRLQHYGTKMGVVKNAKKFNWPAHMELMNYIYYPYKVDKPFTYNHRYVRDTYDWFFAKNKNRFAAAMPADLLFVNRLSFGMDSILADLEGTAEWGAIFRHSVFAEPS